MLFSPDASRLLMILPARGPEARAWLFGKQLVSADGLAWRDLHDQHDRTRLSADPFTILGR